MSPSKKNIIIEWLRTYASENKFSGFVVGISGGIDSSVVSTLCAETGLLTVAVSLPINQNIELDSRSELHKAWLNKNYKNVECLRFDLSETFDQFKNSVISDEIGFVNSKARLRMMALYAIASNKKLLVAGTGNKVEDFGIGFYTKYGDGGVDLSPIGDLMKSEVYEIAKNLGICQEILNAKPTDGLWDDLRTDEDQIGATYDELEWAMNYNGFESITDRQKTVLNLYNTHRSKNIHKMNPIPVCKFNK